MDDGCYCRTGWKEEQLCALVCRRFCMELNLLSGTFCGVFRRQALDRGAASLNVDHIVTGHNADDIAETVLMNSENTCPFSPPANS
jgi:cytoplasmic tRNA 2-thiolation protein 1